MDSEALALSIDCGTQSLRAIVFNRNGDEIAVSRVKFETPYFSSKNGWAEQNPSMWWDSARKAASEVMSKLDYATKSHLKGVCITAFRDSYICLDKDKNVLRPSIIWLDQRVARCDENLGLVNEIAFRAVGMRGVIQKQRQITKYNWIKENEPEIYSKIAYYVSIGCYLTYMFTGTLIDSDSNQCGHIPFDFKNGRFHKKGSLMYSATPVDPRKMAPIVPTGTVMAKISAEVSALTGIPENLPVFAAGTDKACETLGCGVIDSNLAAISFGTAATVELTLDRYVEPQKFMPCYRSTIPGKFNPDIQIYRGYWMVNWFKEQFGQPEVQESRIKAVAPEVLFERLLKETPAGNDGLILQPFWYPELKLIESRGTIMGFCGYHTRAHLYRAIIEGINYALIDGLNSIQKGSKTKAKGICISGGGSTSELICQITSDMFNLPAYICHTRQTSALGAAIMVMVGSGEFESYADAVDSMVRYTKVYQPNPANAKVYRTLYEEVYRKLYPSMKNVYRPLFNYYNEMEKKER